MNTSDINKIVAQRNAKLAKANKPRRRMSGTALCLGPAPADVQKAIEAIRRVTHGR